MLSGLYSSTRRFLPFVTGVVWIGIMLALYVPTIQTDISGHGAPDMIDVGEMQGALTTWGTLHPSGYPLFTILGNLVSSLIRALGGTPATGASVFSVCAGLGALILIYLWLLRLNTHPALAGITVLLIGTGPTLWLNSVVAEVYAFNVILTMGCLLLAFYIGQGAATDRLPWLALLWGAAVSHHRTAILIAPALLWLTWPAFRSPRIYRALGYSVLTGLVPFLTYLYLPLRTSQHAAWLYARTDTWSDFWYVFFSQEYRSFIQPPSSWAEVVDRLTNDWTLLQTEAGLVSVLGLIGLVVASLRQQTRRMGVALALVVLVFTASGLVYAVPDLNAMLLPALIAILIGLPMLAQSLGNRWRRLAELGLALLLLVVMVSQVPSTFASVYEITHDASSRRVITLAQKLTDPRPAIISLWGRDWFAYRYAKYSTGELSAADILPPHTDPRRVWKKGQRVYVASYFFYEVPLSQWKERWGDVVLRSATYGIVEVAPHPETAAPSDLQGQPVDMGAYIRLLGYRLVCSDRSACYLTLYWQCLSTPPVDYHVFVHLTSRVPPQGPEDVLAQADSDHPVYGWYPTSLWTPGEVVRDDYQIPIPDRATPVAIQAGLYIQDSATGSFSNVGVITIPLKDGP